jgi:glutamine amidotransferase
MIVILDLGISNTGSLVNMFRKIGEKAIASTDPETVLAADRVVLPGVGAFGRGIQRLDASGMRGVLSEFVKTKGNPVLGICLGMQLLSRGSEEGEGEGLSLIPASTVKLEAPPESRLRIPHMGWNNVNRTRPHPLFDDMADDAKYYFVHSYRVVCDNPDLVIASTDYGMPFVSGVASGNVMGVQFHPEKSHRFGMQLLQNFARIS